MGSAVLLSKAKNFYPSALVMIRLAAFCAWFFVIRNVACRYAVKHAAPPPLGKVELAVLKIKTRANDKVAIFMHLSCAFII